MSAMAKTLILNIGENPHALQDGKNSSSADISAKIDEIYARVDASLNDYVKIADIVNDLITEDTSKPLSAAQGKELKTQLDLLKADITKIVVEGMGIAAGCGVKVTVENASTVISIAIDENSPLAFNEQNELFIQWSENN